MGVTYNAIRSAFIMGMATSREGFNGECKCDHLAPREIYNRGSMDEVDLWWWFNNKEVQRLADQYMAEVHGAKHAI